MSLADHARMIARSLACALVLAAGCGNLPQASFDAGAPDGSSPDGAPGCPAMPTGSCDPRSSNDCTYGDTVCSCGSEGGNIGSWYCRSVACPPDGKAVGACTGDLTCAYGFEDRCYCRAGQWLCCGGVTACFAPVVPGSPCCYTVAAARCGAVCSDGSGVGCLCSPGGTWQCDACPSVDGGATD
jgi:hypothetical protein